MARVPRSSLPDGYFHAFSRGIASAQPIFRDDDDHTTFLGLLRRTARAHEWTCHAICLMGTHYHLVLKTSRTKLSAGFQRLNWLYAMHFNRKHDGFGHVFADRFGARAIEDEQYLYEACCYVLLNPVRAGLCTRADEWPWAYSRYGLDIA